MSSGISGPSTRGLALPQPAVFGEDNGRRTKRELMDILDDNSIQHNARAHKADLLLAVDRLYAKQDEQLRDEGRKCLEPGFNAQELSAAKLRQLLNFYHVTYDSLASKNQVLDTFCRNVDDMRLRDTMTASSAGANGGAENDGMSAMLRPLSLNPTEAAGTSEEQRRIVADYVDQTLAKARDVIRNGRDVEADKLIKNLNAVIITGTYQHDRLLANHDSVKRYRS